MSPCSWHRFLIASRSANYTSNVLLALFLLICLLDADIIFINRFIYPRFPSLGILLNLTVLIKAPLIFLYILSVIYSDFKLIRKDLLHALPFLLVNLFFIPRFYSRDFQNQVDFLSAGNFQEKQIEIQVSYFILHVQIIIYVIAGFIAV